MTGIRLFNDPSMYGRVPDPPDEPDCPEKYVEGLCEYCSNWDECKKYFESEEEE